ncbi:NADH:flavin oxidoreductase/NADH oxidase family protein [Kordiimonas sp. SCSIO 12610]|uniref:NADH:flavin oxidoreductase/NADH oxidase family protein n=1 Tax=Kordiimonas sp. SCSIO 12610 TaxID=2829597 RepID=UPI002109CAE2|nr:NADH:flavin oxidoreductase/NADH oxidase family protein [Kordiimonas sp. SCSIO 12610]UTW56508.1 NADH:flavin oxidoreductase/NADH oxidase family protein [Kordiimonas sp. SCSIO 12610]
MATLAEPLKLKSGTVLKNRISKAAMNEAMATPDGKITKDHIALYEAWSKSGAGLLVTGNMMVDGRHMNEPLVVDALHEANGDMLAQWAATGNSTDTHIWPQISHPGKQSPKMVNDEPVSPSVVPIPNEMFVSPRELTEPEIEDIIERFGKSAERCEATGFSGIQLHGAHGYLIGQFLSPHHNRRTDKWGGSFDNRIRFVRELYKSVRDKTGKDFNVGIKINSSDFQKGGFGEEESLLTAEVLDDLGFDLIEISGGSWENPINRTGAIKESTRKREAYFLEYAEKIKKKIDTPIMVTGGFRSAAGMNEAIQSGAVDIVGVARPFAVDPEFATHALQDPGYRSTVEPIKSGIKKLDAMAIMEISWYTLQLQRIAKGKAPKRKARGALSAAEVLYKFWKNGRAVKRVRAS